MIGVVGDVLRGLGIVAILAGVVVAAASALGFKINLRKFKADPKTTWTRVGVSVVVAVVVAAAGVLVSGHMSARTASMSCGAILLAALAVIWRK